jgi:glycosyltransferase involved in cell wall biosynthesis
MTSIGFIVYGEIEHTTGGNYYDRMLISALESNGHTVTVLDPASAKSNSPSPEHTLKADAYIIDELCHPDFSSAQDFTSFGKNTPLIAMVHHLAAQERLSLRNRVRHLRQERRFLSHMDYCICNSASTESAIRTLARYDGPAGIAVPGVLKRVDSAKRKPATPKKPEPGKPVKLVALGNVISRKGIHHILTSMKIEPQLPCCLDIAGDLAAEPEYTEALKYRVKQLKLDDRVRFLGFVTEEEKEKLLTQSRFIVVPSDYEGYGIVYLEAMEYGTVPVGSISGGAGEVIKNGYNGFLVHPAAPREIYRIISDCITDPDVYGAVSRHARETWEKHPSWEVTFDGIIEDLKTVL